MLYPLELLVHPSLLPLNYLTPYLVIFGLLSEVDPSKLMGYAAPLLSNAASFQALLNPAVLSCTKLSYYKPFESYAVSY
jgi:hypothetical protein